MIPISIKNVFLPGWRAVMGGLFALSLLSCGGGGGSPGAVGGGNASGGTGGAIASTPLAVLPAAATANVGDVLSFQISGGTPGYTVNVNNQSIAMVSAATLNSNGATFSAALMNAGSTPVSIVDSKGNAASVTLTVTQASTLLRLSPSALLVGENDKTPITLHVYGGTGPYTARTSDLLMSSVLIDQANRTMTVGTGSNGSRCINPVNATGVYVISGTYPVTLTVVDSLGASATSIMTIQDNGSGLGLGCP